MRRFVGAAGILAALLAGCAKPPATTPVASQQSATCLSWAPPGGEASAGTARCLWWKPSDAPSPSPVPAAEWPVVERAFRTACFDRGGSVLIPPARVGWTFGEHRIWCSTDGDPPGVEGSPTGAPATS